MVLIGVLGKIVIPLKLSMYLVKRGEGLDTKCTVPYELPPSIRIILIAVGKDISQRKVWTVQMKEQNKEVEGLEGW